MKKAEEEVTADKEKTEEDIATMKKEAEEEMKEINTKKRSAQRSERSQVNRAAQPNQEPKSYIDIINILMLTIYIIDY